MLYLFMIKFACMETMTQSPVRFTAGALEEISRLQSMDTSKILRIGVKGGGCSGLSYVLEFDQRKESDQDYEFNGLHYIMDKAHEIYLSGIEIDWENGLNNRGFTFKNPNASSTCGCGTSFAV